MPNQRHAPSSIATWNVNSIRARSSHVLAWLREKSPDVLSLQELKLPTESFPSGEFEGLDYHSAVHGQKTWNGVALLSREPLADVRKGLPELAEDAQSRVISGRWGEVRLIGVYVPNGESVESEKFSYKMLWLDALARHLEANYRPDEPLALFGDFNIAPEDRDVFDPDSFAGKVLFSEPEHAALRRLLDWGLVDLFRQFHSEGKHYSWWDYRMAAFRRNLGARIDLILCTRPLAERAVSCEIDVAPRKLEKPSDHTPVVAAFR